MPKRIVVVGPSGSGKSTLARQLAARLGCARLELDALQHQPDWQPLPTDAFRASLDTFVRRHDRWVVDGNYPASHDLIWPHADTVVWLDLPTRVSFGALLRRSLRRVLTRELLWNGNRERLHTLLSLDPEQSVLLDALLRQRTRYRRRYSAAMVDPAHRHLHFVRLRSRRAVQGWLGSLPG